jgi:hypothetical protein
MSLKKFLEGYKCTKCAINLFSNKDLDFLLDNAEKYCLLDKGTEESFTKTTGYFSGLLINEILHPMRSARILAYKEKNIRPSQSLNTRYHFYQYVK